MALLFIFFGVLIVLELIALLGLIVVFLWVQQTRRKLKNSEVAVQQLAKTTRDSIRTGQFTLLQLLGVAKFSARFLPPWIRIPLTILGRLA